MKNISLIINAVLAVAVAFLLIQHFKAPHSATPASGTSEATSADQSPKIVFVNADTLLEKYDYFKEKKAAMDKKEKDADASLKARGKALEKEYVATQQKVQQGLLTPKEIQQAEQALGLKQQRLMEEQDRLTKELVAETQKIQDELQQTVKDILANIRKEKGYDYILSYGPGTGVLMVNDSLDVTDLVLEALNKEKPQPKE